MIFMDIKECVVILDGAHVIGDVELDENVSNLPEIEEYV